MGTLAKENSNGEWTKEDLELEYLEAEVQEKLQRVEVAKAEARKLNAEALEVEDKRTSIRKQEALLLKREIEESSCLEHLAGSQKEKITAELNTMLTSYITETIGQDIKTTVENIVKIVKEGR